MKCISPAKVFHFPRPTKESFLKDVKGFEKSYSSRDSDGAGTIQVLYNINIVSIFVKRFEAMRSGQKHRAVEFLKSHQSGTPSKWRADAQCRRDNEFWLTYSRHITLQVLRGMDEQSVTQAELARRMGCSQQYVSNLLKGSSNMTLETIARLEIALNLDILKTALADVDKYAAPNHPHIHGSKAREVPDGK